MRYILASSSLSTTELFTAQSRKNTKRRPSSNMISGSNEDDEWQIRQAMGWIFSTLPPALLKQRTRSSLIASPVNHDGKPNSVSRLPQFTVPIPIPPPAGKKQSQTTNKMAISPKD